MGRGKKKGGQDKEAKAVEATTSALETLSISETPLTSQSQPVADVEEEFSGLTGGGARKKPKKKKQEVASETPTTAPAEVVTAPTPSVVESQPKKEEVKTQEEDEGGLGLGLGGGRRRQKKKQPTASTSVPAVSAQPTPSQIQPVQGQTQDQPVSVKPDFQKRDQPWGAPASAPPGFASTGPGQGRGAGRGAGRGRGQAPYQPGPPPTHQQPIPPTAFQQPGAPPIYQQPGPYPPHQQPGPYPPHQQPGPYPHQQPGPYPPHQQPGSYPPHQQPGPYPPHQQPGPYPTYQQPGPPPTYQQPGPSPTYQQPGPYPPHQQPGPPPNQQQPRSHQQPSPSTTYTTVPATAPSQGQAATPVKPKSSGTDTALCRFKIPRKILGNSVPVRAIQVLTNYLQMSIKPLKVYRYDVSFKPERPKKALAKAFALSKNMHFKNAVVAFDQIKNCYTIEKLPKVPQNDRFITNVEFKDDNGKTMAFEVSYKFTGMVDLGTLLTYVQTGGTSLSPPTEAIQCIDVVLRQGTLESYVKAGRQFFQRPARPIDLGDGLEMWTGLFQSAIFTTRPFINIDVAHKGFPKQQSLIDALRNDFRLDLRSPIDTQRGRGVENFHHFLKGLRVVAKVGGDKSASGQKREFICNGLMGPATKERFAFEDPKTKEKKSMSVAEYFMRIKGVRLQYPDLNCIWVGPREKTIYYPIELLEVSYGQALNKQLNDTQLATMVRQAATPPDERKRKIEEVIKNMNYSNNPTFAKFGLSISNEFYPVKAKVLMPPKLEVGRGQVLEPRRGVWQANQVYKPEALQSWGFIAIECDPSRCDFDSVKDMMMKMGRMMGMNVSEPKMTRYNVTMRDLQNVLFSALESDVKFLFVVVSARGRDYYHRVKQIAERDVGILTQCIKEQTATNKMNMQTAKNILLKVNSKLMGINQALDGRCMPKCLKDGGVMVVGADVTHPSPEQTSIPSIAAVTASMDPQCFKYNIELSIQTPKKEMIVEFEDMMVDHLKVYYQHQKSLPKKIFVFRDGVSEGQFAQVMNSELQAVHNAYRTLAGPNAKPEVLFLLVQKRHHTRLFVPNSNQNVDPGTVVDTDIVHASELDFYLVSHAAIKGTARPTRYHAVCNDGGIPHDEVEQLTYYLCHLYSRCMRAVSYPTPTYYAHLACLRARSLTHGEKFNNQELEQRPKRLRVMDKILKYSRMFFV